MRFVWLIIAIVGLLSAAVFNSHANEKLMKPDSWTYESGAEFERSNTAVTTQMPTGVPDGLKGRSEVPQVQSALSLLGQGRAAVAIMSRANVPLRIFFLHDNLWQERTLNPLGVTFIKCDSCQDKLRFSFHDGEERRDIHVDLSSIISITPDETGTHWNIRKYRIHTAD